MTSSASARSRLAPRRASSLYWFARQLVRDHDRPASGSWLGIEIEIATASGISCGMSVGTNSLNPMMPAALAVSCGGWPHSGQASKYAAAAALNRKRQLRQPTWVMTDGLSALLS
jgi:hypothetical protein